ncbi:MAG: ATP synthase F0 subunit C [Candidatus Margulisbacteria bacterium GWF2_35_9]|nr:MAG: ATP synthase F0 subunit C [Candidatus Margulisbacteria bacterium GWF2_35_9]
MEYIGAGLAIAIPGLGAAIAIGMIGGKTVESIARQPEMTNTLRANAIIMIAFVEGVALYGLVISFLLMNK